MKPLTSNEKPQVNARRVNQPWGVSRATFLGSKRRRPGSWKSRSRRLEPLDAARSDVSIVPKQPSAGTPKHTPEQRVATDSEAIRDRELLAIADQAGITDRQYRVFAALVYMKGLGREVDAATMYANLPWLESESQAGNVLGKLAGAGLVAKRTKVVGYEDGKRRRIRVYSIADGLVG